jgi:hypothetical protein
MRRYDYKQAVDPFFDKPAFCEGEHGCFLEGEVWFQKHFCQASRSPRYLAIARRRKSASTRSTRILGSWARPLMGLGIARTHTSVSVCICPTRCARTRYGSASKTAGFSRATRCGSIPERLLLPDPGGGGTGAEDTAFVTSECESSSASTVTCLWLACRTTASW